MISAVWLYAAIPVVTILVVAGINAVYLAQSKRPAKQARRYAEAKQWTYSSIVHLSWMKWARPIYGDDNIVEGTLNPFTPATPLVQAHDAVMGEIDGLKVVSFQMILTKPSSRKVQPYQHVVAVRLPFNEQPTIGSEYLLREVMGFSATDRMDAGLDFVDVNEAWLILTAEQRARAVDALNLAVTDWEVESNLDDPAIIVDSDYMVSWKPGLREFGDIDPMAAQLARLIHRVPPALWDIRFT